ncbi:MAG: DEAD/DEAH box helicase family protein, partial [Actinomycetota bacterium]|nr:DEAD/DEAH box helicase family protein [Actinomycetota bacterium]
MADSTPAAPEAAPIAEQTDVLRAEKFTRERFVHDGEDVAVALARGTARRRALDAALRELDEGAKVPSTRWRRRYALLLGLERLLSEDEPRLKDGTTLNPHQVDALSGTLTALLAAAQNGSSAAAPAAAPVLAIEEERPEPEAPEAEEGPEPDEDDDELDEDDEDVEDDDELPAAAAPPYEDDDVDDDLEDDEDEDDDEEPEAEPEDSWDDDEEDVDEDLDASAAEDPNAHKRFWFEHATGAGKTVAAMGFVEASRTGGVLILTHRRNLVDQFLGELRTRGYAERESPALLLDPDGKDR